MTLASSLFCVAVLAISCHGHPSFRHERSLEITPSRRTSLNTNIERGRRDVPPSSYKPVEPPPPPPGMTQSAGFSGGVAEVVRGCVGGGNIPGMICGPIGMRVSAPQEVVTIKQSNDYNGTFFYSFEDESGIYVEVKGYPKTLDNGAVVQAMKGEYSHTAPDGTLITTKWFADETGYHAKGATYRFKKGDNSTSDFRFSRLNFSYN